MNDSQALSRSAEESWKVIHNPQKKTRHQNITDSSFGHAPPVKEI